MPAPATATPAAPAPQAAPPAATDPAATDPAGGHGDSAQVALASRSAQDWLALVDRKMYSASWDSASAYFQQTVTREQWTEAVLRARTQFEPFGARELVGSRYAASLPNAPAGEFIVLQFETDVSGDRQVSEIVVEMRQPDGRWRPAGYFVREAR
jgi:hypothetical protein